MQGLQRVLMLFHTVRYLKSKQVFYQLRYRFLRLFPVCKKTSTRKMETTEIRFLPCIPKHGSLDHLSFTFLNLTRKYHSVQTINWDEPAFGKLWTYNLNYFDFLHQHDHNDQTGKMLIEDFISKYPDLKTAREPYTISLRVINWIKWISGHHIGGEFQALLNVSLQTQIRCLTKRLEYHLMGNHLLENAFALLFGAFYFSDQSLYKKTNQILQKELQEQVLPDGAHFELSPMYHQIILDRILDGINLLQNNKIFPDQDVLYSLLCAKASHMLGWLEQITFTKGEIPLVNDAATGIAPSTGALQAYADQLGIGRNKIALKESGYRMFHGKEFELLVDCGIPGPDYIPGHAHADIFNFVLYLRGKSFVVDTGTSSYEAGKIRSSERSTAAHNTVQVNGREQSDTWGAFRMGRRAAPIITADGSHAIAAYHKGFKPNIHERKFDIGDKNITIIDQISGPAHEAVAYLHFEQGTAIQILNNTIVTAQCKIHVTNAQQIMLDQYKVADGFNILKTAPLVRIKFRSYLETVFEL